MGIETLKRLEARVTKLRAEKREREEKKLRKHNMRYLGKTYKWRNCYSCPEKDSDYWWFYLKVKEISADGSLVCSTFEKTSTGIIKFEPGYGWFHEPQDDWTEITEAEYLQAFSALRKEVFNWV